MISTDGKNRMDIEDAGMVGIFLLVFGAPILTVIGNMSNFTVILLFAVILAVFLKSVYNSRARG